MKSRSVKKNYMRIVRVEDMLLSGYRPVEVCEILSAEWKLTTTQIEKYIRKVRNQWASYTQENMVELRNKYVMRLESLYRKSVEKEQYATAAKIQDLINKVSGIYETEQKNSSGPEVITISGTSKPVAQLGPSTSEVVIEDDDNGGEDTRG